jgi:tetratricopeptide (TPR) repeat protein
MAALLAVLIPAALATTTALHLRAERRGRESLAYRLESVERLSRLALARSRELHAAEALELHRACAEEYTRLAEAGVDPSGSRLHRAEQIAWQAYDLLRFADYHGAEGVADEAIRAFETCLTEQPDSPAARQGLFEAQFHRATAIRLAERFAESLPLLDDLVARAPGMYGDDLSAGGQLSLTLRDIHQGRASALYSLGRYGEAATAYDDALRYDDGAKWPDLIIIRAGLYARSGRAGEAVETLRAQLANPHLSTWNVFNAGCAYAVASTADDLPGDARSAAAEAAIVAIRRAVTADPSMRRAVERDRELNPLRARPDFQALLAGK